MELEVCERPIFRPTLSTIMIQRVLRWERQKRFSRCKCQGTIAEKCCFMIVFSFPQMFPYLRGKKGQNSGEGQTWKKTLKISLVGHILKKSTHPLLDAWPLLLIHVQFTPTQGSKAFKFKILRNWTMEVWPWIIAHWHEATSWSQLFLTLKLQYT